MKHVLRTSMECSSPTCAARGWQPALRRAVCALLLATFVMAAQPARAQMLPGSDAAVAAPDSDDPSAREAWMRERFGDVHSPYSQQALLAERQRESMRRTRQPTSVGAGRWMSIGPSGDDYIQNGPVTLFAVDSGRVRTILVDPLDATGDSLYVLTSGGGLWRSVHAANAPQWQPLTDALPTTSGGSVALGNDPHTLYLGLGDPFDYSPGLPALMTASPDRGAHWSAPVVLSYPSGATTRFGSAIADVKVDDRGSDIVLVATLGGGVFRSVDGGATYASVLPDVDAWSLVRSSAGWLAATRAADGNGTIFLSTDLGASWSPISNGGNGYANAGRTTLAVAMPGDAIVYAYAALPDGSDQSDLFRSSDGGQSWSTRNLAAKVPQNPNADQPDMDLMYGQAWYNQLLLVDPTDATRATVYIGGALSTARSTDRGDSWALISNWLPGGAQNTSSLPYVHADCHAAAFSTLGGTPRLYFGTDGGVFVSNDGGTHWDGRLNRDLVTTLHYSVVSSPAFEGSVLTGLQDAGTRVRKDQTGIYQQSLGGDGFGVGWSQTDGAVSLGSLYYGDIRRSMTNPPYVFSNWAKATTGIGSAPNFAFSFYTPLATPALDADATGRDFFTHSLSNVFATGDGAANWQSIGSTSADGFNGMAQLTASPHGLGIGLDAAHVAVAGSDGAAGAAIAFSVDAGAHWSTASVSDQVPGFPAGSAACVEWANATTLYACSEKGLGSQHVARSIDGGTTWTGASGNLPAVPVFKLQAERADASGNTMIAATCLGVYRTTDGGATWASLGTGLPGVAVTDLYLSPDSVTLRAATYGRGIWELVPRVGAIEGVVTNAATGAGVSDGVVRIINAAFTQVAAFAPDGAGAYASANLSPGMYTVVAQFAGYVVQQKPVVVDQVPVSVDFALAYSGGVHGVVTALSGGQPLSNGSVTIRDAANAIVGVAVPDGAGSYTWDNLAPGAYTATAEFTGYATAQKPFNVDATSVVVDFALADATATIEGRVTALGSGDALSDGQVTVRDGGGALVATAVPDATGFYAASGLAPGSYSVYAQFSGYVVGGWGVSIGAGSTLTLDFELAPGDAIYSDGFE